MSIQRCREDLRLRLLWSFSWEIKEVEIYKREIPFRLSQKPEEFKLLLPVAVTGV